MAQNDAVSWALLLKPVGNSTQTFKRVGLAMLYHKTWDMTDAQLQDFQVI
jgi:hypothetical protein